MLFSFCPALHGPALTAMTFPTKDAVRRLKLALFQRGVSPQDVDDLIQEAFQRLEAHRRSHTVEKPEGFVLRTALNLAVDRFRHRKQASLAADPVEAFDIIDETPLPDEVYASRQRLEHLKKGFTQLDPLTRSMLQAQRLEGLSVEAIARRHELSISAVEKRLAKGLLFLVGWMDGW